MSRVEKNQNINKRGGRLLEPGEYAYKRNIVYSYEGPNATF